MKAPRSLSKITRATSLSLRYFLLHIQKIYKFHIKQIEFNALFQFSYTNFHISTEHTLQNKICLIFQNLQHLLKKYLSYHRLKNKKHSTGTSTVRLPWKGTGGRSRRGRSAGCRSYATTVELEQAHATALPSPNHDTYVKTTKRQICLTYVA